MKTIYVDITVLLRSKFVTGIQRVTIEVLKRLVQSQSEYKITLLSERDDNSFYQVDLNQFIKSYVSGQNDIGDIVTPRIIRLDDMTRHTSSFFDIDSVWGCSHSRLNLYPKLKKRNIRIITLVYDLIVLSHPQYTSEENIANFPRYIAAVAKYSDVVILNTQDAANQLKHFAKKGGIGREIDCRVIPLGADFAKTAVDLSLVSKCAKKIAQGKPYILMVSTIEPRKNHKVLLDAFDQGLADLGVQMVFAGKQGWNVDELMDRIRKHPRNKKTLHHLEGENDETIRFLYQNAFMVFFPTYIEGYGLATIEAMQQHTPVALSDIPVMHEVGGEYCDYFDPDSPGEIIDIVKKYISDKSAYQKKKEMLDGYVPFTWDQMAGKVLEILLEECREDIGEINLQQMVMLTARADDFLNTVPYIENRMRFISEIVLFCPEWTKKEIMESYKGTISLKYVTDDELLKGRALPEDHGERNFFLRTLIVKHKLVDDFFIMSDDDYRPLEDISTNFYIQDGKMNAFYFYDLDLWESDVTMSTSFDRLQMKTNRFLKENGYPNLQYASHMPQIICKRWFADMLEKHNAPPMAGVCEWGSYFNYVVKEHPNAVNVRPYVTLAWPMHMTDWDMMVVPEKYYFENHYEELYQEGQVFAGYASLYGSNADAASKRIVNDWTKYVTEYKVGIESMNEYRHMRRTSCGADTNIQFALGTDGAQFFAPKELCIKEGAICRFPVHMIDGMDQFKNAQGKKLFLGWSFRNAEILRRTSMDLTGKIMLTVGMPKQADLLANPAEYEKLYLYYAIDDGPFTCSKEILLQFTE